MREKKIGRARAWREPSPSMWHSAGLLGGRSFRFWSMPSGVHLQWHFAASRLCYVRHSTIGTSFGGIEPPPIRSLRLGQLATLLPRKHPNTGHGEWSRKGRAQKNTPCPGVFTGRWKWFADERASPIVPGPRASLRVPPVGSPAEGSSRQRKPVVHRLASSCYFRHNSYKGQSPNPSVYALVTSLLE